MKTGSGTSNFNNSLVARLRDDVFGSMNGRVKAIASLFF
jgi:hypothetical protein